MRFNFKKMLKKVNLRGVLKVANNFTSMIPIVGGAVSGIVDGAIQKAEQKKADRQAQQEAQQALAQQPQYEALSNTEKLDAINNTVPLVHAARAQGVSIKEVLSGAAGGALQGAGTVLAGDTNVANAGAKLADNTMMAWLKKNWWKPALGLVALFGVIKLAMKPKRTGGRKW